jgi:hypothetical protein
MTTLLSLDMSTSCTGWSLFDVENNKLITYGTLKPSTKGGVAKMVYPLQQLTKMVDLSFQIRTLILNYKPTKIVIEEIAGSRQRLGQKVLDGLHWVVLMHIQEFIGIVEYYDVTGSNGWRTALGLKLSELDKLRNKEAKKMNPNLDSKSRLPIVDAKDLAARYANENYGLSLDPQANQYDADIADSVSMGSAYIKFKCPRS